MNQMARQTKTVDVLDPSFFTTLVDFVTEFISLIVENVVGAAGISRYWINQRKHY